VPALFSGAGGAYHLTVTTSNIIAAPAIGSSSAVLDPAVELGGAPQFLEPELFSGVEAFYEIDVDLGAVPLVEVIGLRSWISPVVAARSGFSASVRESSGLTVVVPLFSRVQDVVSADSILDA
jgi:hypothetical protein